MPTKCDLAGRIFSRPCINKSLIKHFLNWNWTIIVFITFLVISKDPPVRNLLKRLQISLLDQWFSTFSAGGPVEIQKINCGPVDLQKSPKILYVFVSAYSISTSHDRFKPCCTIEGLGLPSSFILLKPLTSFLMFDFFWKNWIILSCLLDYIYY